MTANNPVNADARARDVLCKVRLRAPVTGNVRPQRSRLGAQHSGGRVEISKQQLTEWAESCLRINHLNTLVQREIDTKSVARAKELSERARMQAWRMFNEMVAQGADKPKGYAEPGAGPVEA
jgi:hypothetical protein